MKKLLSIVLAGSMLLFNGFMLFEGGVVSADTQDTTTVGSGGAVNLSYPVELTVDPELSLTCDVSTSTMLSNIPGMTGGTAVSNRLCNVKTNNMVGYTMQAKAAGSPALVNVASSTYFFPDFASTTPGVWSSPAATASEFGFNVTGTDADSAFSGSKYRGFDSTNQITVAGRGIPTDNSGINTTLNYKAEVGSSANQATGLYRSITTITAYMN